jgi:hypothetical protein
MEANEYGFHEQIRRKRHNPSENEAPQRGNKKPAPYVDCLKQNKTIRSFFAPLRAGIEVEEKKTEEGQPSEGQQRSTGADRPPPIVLTSSVNLIQLQKTLKDLVRGGFEFRNTRNGTRVVTREIVDYSAIWAHFDNQKYHYYTFHTKSEKPIKTVIRQLQINTPAEDISSSQEDLGCSIISVKQMTSSRPSAEAGTHPTNQPLFLITLDRSEKSKDIFKLTNICHIAVKVEAYRAQSGLTQCYNCQKFGHVLENCRQPPRYLWCGGGHLHKECPETQKENSTAS